jgi:hypothetical protein
MICPSLRSHRSHSTSLRLAHARFRNTARRNKSLTRHATLRRAELSLASTIDGAKADPCKRSCSGNETAFRPRTGLVRAVADESSRNGRDGPVISFGRGSVLSSGQVSSISSENISLSSSGQISLLFADPKLSLPSGAESVLDAGRRLLISGGRVSRVWSGMWYQPCLEMAPLRRGDVSNVALQMKPVWKLVAAISTVGDLLRRVELTEGGEDGCGF